MILIRKFTQKEVEEYFYNNNCELLSNYIDIKTKVKYRCECGELSEISFDNFKRGKRCNKCGLQKLANNFKHDIEYVKKYFIKNNCFPLFDNYINNHAPLKYQCECGNISSISFADFQNGKRCSKCKTERAVKTMYNNNSQITSKQQLWINELLNGKLNYPVGNSSLDIAFPDVKIYVEYDGGGHDLRVKLGKNTQEEFNFLEQKRTYALFRRGWKKIKLVSRKDKLPNKNTIIDIFNYGKEYLDLGHSWIDFDFDNKLIINSQFKMNCDFGLLNAL